MKFPRRSYLFYRNKLWQFYWRIAFSFMVGNEERGVRWVQFFWLAGEGGGVGCFISFILWGELNEYQEDRRSVDAIFFRGPSKNSQTEYANSFISRKYKPINWLPHKKLGKYGSKYPYSENRQFCPTFSEVLFPGKNWRFAIHPSQLSFFFLAESRVQKRRMALWCFFWNIACFRFKNKILVSERAADTSLPCKKWNGRHYGNRMDLGLGGGWWEEVSFCDDPRRSEACLYRSGRGYVGIINGEKGKVLRKWTRRMQWREYLSVTGRRGIRHCSVGVELQDLLCPVGSLYLIPFEETFQNCATFFFFYCLPFLRRFSWWGDFSLWWSVGCNADCFHSTNNQLERLLFDCCTFKCCTSCGWCTSWQSRVVDGVSCL